jgi:Proteasome subunit
VAMDFKKVNMDKTKITSGRFLTCHLPLTLSPQVFEVSDKLYIGLTGLATDVISVEQLLRFRHNLYKLRENREMKPEVFSALLSTLLYEKRYDYFLVAFYCLLSLLPSNVPSADFLLGSASLLWRDCLRITPLSFLEWI